MHFAAFLVLHIYGGFLLFLCFDFVTDFSVFMFIYIYIYILENFQVCACFWLVHMDQMLLFSLPLELLDCLVLVKGTCQRLNCIQILSRVSCNSITSNIKIKPWISHDV